MPFSQHSLIVVPKFRGNGFQSDRRRRMKIALEEFAPFFSRLLGIVSGSYHFLFLMQKIFLFFALKFNMLLS